MSLENLQKKREKTQKDLERLKVAYEKQARNLKAKEDELKQLDAEIVAELLVENGIAMDDLTSLLSEGKKSESISEPPKEVKSESTPKEEE